MKIALNLFSYPHEIVENSFIPAKILRPGTQD